ncbi:hypothetical protein GCM10023083_29060 [Streptomyces phyllanthi]
MATGTSGIGRDLRMRATASSTTDGRRESAPDRFDGQGSCHGGLPFSSLCDVPGDPGGRGSVNRRAGPDHHGRPPLPRA